MGKKKIYITPLLVILTLLSTKIYPQNIQLGEQVITADQIRTHLSFFASPLLEGRGNGEKGLEMAQQYIVSQSEILGLKPGNGQSYLQPFPVTKTSFDEGIPSMELVYDNGGSMQIDQTVYQLVPSSLSDLSLSGEIVFAGYGLKQMVYGYDDYKGIDLNGKIVLIMDGAPTTEDGKTYLFGGNDWSDFSVNIQAKASYAMTTKAKAVIIVPNPKSGAKTVDDIYIGLEHELKATWKLGNKKDAGGHTPKRPIIMMTGRLAADKILEGCGYTLEELQYMIDSELKPHSLEITGKKLSINKRIKTEEIILNNAAAYIEGSDSLVKDEYVVFSCHADHIGMSNGLVNTGADDNASGCSSILAIAKAFKESAPKRSILFLWFAGEEIGLFGSQYFVDNPLVPLENIVADLNIDMIGRSRGVADTTEATPMTGPNGLFVITGLQSSELSSIANEIDEQREINFDYSLGGIDHPLNLFQLSDHFNFVKNDIPSLFFFTGLHSDYHSPGDTLEKIDFTKMEEITKTIFLIGSTIANKKERLIVDNPYSNW